MYAYCNKLLPLARMRPHRSELKSHFLSLYEAAERSLKCPNLIGCLLRAKKEQKEIKCDHAPRAVNVFGCLPTNPLQQFCSQTPRSLGKRYPSPLILPLIIISPLLSFVDFVNFSTNRAKHQRTPQAIIDRWQRQYIQRIQVKTLI